MSHNKHQYRNLNFFSYDTAETARTADAGKRTLNDWNRHVRKGAACAYFINGTRLSELRAEKTTVNGKEQIHYKEFANVEELKQFFKQHIFNKMSAEKTKVNPDKKVIKTHKKHPIEADPVRRLAWKKFRAREREKQADLAATQACLQWHQAGIQHATYQHAYMYSLNKFPHIGLTDPVANIHFDSVEGGAKITEENIYRQWSDMSKSKPVKHIRSEKENYYAKTQTTYLFQPDHIQMTDLVIDCPSVALAPLFDTRPASEQATRFSNKFLRALNNFMNQAFPNQSKEIPSVEVQENTQTDFKLPRH